MGNDLINCKVAIIDKNGVIHMMGQMGDGQLHVSLFKKYISETYGNILKINIDDQTPREEVCYYLVELGNVIYTNDYLFSSFYFPSNLSEKQFETLENLELGEMIVGINYECDDNRHEYIGDDGEHDFKMAFAEYLNKKNNKTR